MKYFVGLDVSMKKTSVCIVDLAPRLAPQSSRDYAIMVLPPY